MMKSKPEPCCRLVRKSAVDQGRPMEKLKKIASFVFVNRRVIGSIVGSSLVLLGYVDEGNFIQRVGEQ